jgi:protein lifeguard
MQITNKIAFLKLLGGKENRHLLSCSMFNVTLWFPKTLRLELFNENCSKDLHAPIIFQVQLLITLAFICMIVYNESARLWMKRNPAVHVMALVVMLVTLICISCCTEVRRKAPMNYIFLGLFTFAQSFMLAAMCTRFRSQEIVLAVGLTAIICLALTLFAFQTKWDFTVLGGMLFVAAIVLLIFGLVAMFYKGKIMTLVYASMGALLFSFYLIYDTQMMMGGQHKYSISPEDYVFSALSLYMVGGAFSLTLTLFLSQLIGFCF